MVESTAANGHTPHDWRIVGAPLVAGFPTWVFGELRHASDPKWEDTEGHPADSLYIADHGGVLGHLKQSFAGGLPVVERYSLYMPMQASIASRTAEFYWNLKLVNLATGMIALLSEAHSDSCRPTVVPSIAQHACLISGNLHPLGDH